MDDEYLEIGHGQPSERHPNFVQKFVAQGGAPADGWYTIRVRAAAANRRDHGYDHREFLRFETMPLKLALWIAPQARLLSKNAAEERRLVKVWDLPDGTPEVFTQRVWLGKGFGPVSQLDQRGFFQGKYSPRGREVSSRGDSGHEDPTGCSATG